MDIIQQIEAAERELRLRRACYPRFIEQNRLTSGKAQHELAAMEAIVETLKTEAIKRGVGPLEEPC